VECGWIADKYGLSWQVIPAKFFAEWVKDGAGLQRVMHEVWQDEEARSGKATEGICRKVTGSISQLSTLLQ